MCEGHHSLICKLRCGTVVARHNLLMESWRRVKAHAGIASAVEHLGRLCRSLGQRHPDRTAAACPLPATTSSDTLA